MIYVKGLEIKNKDLIYVVPKSKINHLAAKAVDKNIENEVEFSRNWHWIWSKFYFNKKHYGEQKKLFMKAFPRYCSSLLLIFILFFD